MIKKNKVTLVITTLVMLLPMLIGLLLWNDLPEQIPTHWNLHGEVDGWSSKGLAVFALPSLLIGIQWLCAFACGADPKSKNYHPKMIGLMLWICPIVSLALSTVVYAAALGETPKVDTIMPLIMGALFLIIGNLMPKCRQSYTMGIKLPWTLANEENWNKTHRFAGKIWTAGGILIMISALWNNLVFFISVTALMVLIPTIYSYLLHRKQTKLSDNQ